MDKISIIVPIRNAERYIGKCIDSLTIQTYKNLEILLINDGSTDRSGDICEERAKKDSRLRVIHNENSGISSARNTGLTLAVGEYVGFADADDWIEPDMYEILYNYAKEKSIPISISNFFKDTDSGSSAMDNKKGIRTGVIPPDSMITYALDRDSYMGFCAYVWNKLFSSDIIGGGGLLFDESINYGEDVLFFVSAVLSKRCTGVYSDKPLYHYCQRKSSVSKTKSVSVKRDILTAYKKIETAMQSSGFYGLRYLARGFYCYHAGEAARIAYESGDAEALRDMQGEIEAHLDDYEATNMDYPEKCERMRQILDLNL